MISAEYHRIVIGVTLLALVISLFRQGNRAGLSFFLAAMVLVVSGVITTDDFLRGFGNRQIAIIFVLIFISGALRDHFNLLQLLDRPFRSVKTGRAMMLRMTGIVALFSSVLNNTPVVAIMIPYITDWCKKKGINPSKLLIPLSYAAIMGGMITLIGTSTNLVLNGFLEQNGEPLFGFFDFLIPGLLVTVFGILFLYFFGQKLLPERQDVIDQLGDPSREYVVETKLKAGSELIGKTVQGADLRNLEGIFLIEIVRAGEVIAPVSPEEVLHEGDSLLFVGDTATIMTLVNAQNGLELSKHTEFDPAEGRKIIEAVVPANSSLIGFTVKHVNFRERYQAGILAIHRNGERVSGKIGEITLMAGDLLLLSTGKSFANNQFRYNNLYIVNQVKSPITKSSPPKRVFFGVLFAVVVAGISGYFTLFMASLVLLAALLVLGFVNVDGMKKEMDVKLLLILVSALAIGQGIIASGTAEWLAGVFNQVFAGGGPLVLSIALFVLTLLLTSFITNAAAISIVFPLAYALGSSLPNGAEGFYLTIAFAASSAFLTPMGYQTNLMVMGPGGYRVKDFMRIGLPMTLIYAFISLSFVWIKYGWI